MQNRIVRNIGCFLLSLLGVAGLVLLPVAAVIAIFAGGFTIAGRAVEKPRQEALSPDGRYLAVSFVGSAGATTGLSYHVNLRESGRPFRETTYGWIEDGQVYHAWGGNSPAERLIWKDATHLIIQAHLGDPKYRKTRWRDVTISYEEPPVEIVHRLTWKTLRRIPRLWSADLRNAQLSDADLTLMDLSQAQLQGAVLRSADLMGTRLRRADLRGADLRQANLQHADLTGARLEAADLRKARLVATILTAARYDRRTRWPSGFDPAQAGAMRIRQ